MKANRILSIILAIIFIMNFMTGTVSLAVNEIENISLKTENVENTNEETENVENSITNDNTDTNENTEKGNVTENVVGNIENNTEEKDAGNISENKETVNETNTDNAVENNNDQETVKTKKEDVVETNSEENNNTVSVMSMENKSSDIGVTYQGHGQDYGWQGWVSNGELSGTDGESRRMEGIRIKLLNAPSNAKILYRIHGKDYGWQGWKSNGELGGTVGESRRIEAIQIKLENLDDYTVEYRAQGQDYGWQGWVSEGEIAGTTGQSRRIEGIEIRIIKKQKSSVSVKYQGQGQDYGWQGWVSDGKLAGTNGESKRLEGIKIQLVNAPEGAKIIYQAHGQGYGWQNYVQEGEYAGTVGESKRLEGIRIQLQNMDDYSVEYRAQVEDYGWLNWVSDGELAGTVGESKRLEGLQIKIVPRIKHSKIEIEEPTRNVLTSNNINISGYALSEYKNTVVKVYVDSKLISVARKERGDVFSGNQTTNTTIKVNYGNITTNPTPGYYGEADLSDLSSGIHTITAKIFDSTEKNVLATAKKSFSYYKDRKYGIDVSSHQGKINWSNVRQSNVDFAMVRIGFRGYGTGKIVSDTNSVENINGVINNGIKCGVYFFSQAMNRDEGIEEARWVLEEIKSQKYNNIRYPIAIDTEWANNSHTGRADSISVEDRTAAIKGFVETIRNAGETPIIYASKDWLINHLNMSELSGYDVWLAHYGIKGAPDNTSDYTGNYTMWQYTSSGSINGINGNVDMDISYKKYGE